MCEDLIKRLQLGGYTTQAVADALTAMSANIAAKDKQIEVLKANSAIQEMIIRNNSNPLDKDRIVSLVLRKIELEQQLAKVTVERDMAVEDIKKPSVCDCCKYVCQGDRSCIDKGYSCFTWRGLQKED